MTVVRMDSLDPSGASRSYRFTELLRVIEVWSIGEVSAALSEVELAAAQGCHAAGFVAYEAAAAFDQAIASGPPHPRVPLVWFGIFEQRVEVVRESPPAGEYALGDWRHEIDAAQYADRVARVRQLIRAGDTYQVNLTHRVRAEFSGQEEALYRRLCLSQRSAYCAFIQTDKFAILSASPELFFRSDARGLEMRPMKGTAPRGRWAAEDDDIAQRLEESAKERSENLMIVDLLRNDAGRIAEFGSVSVPMLFEVERYPTIHQLTSTVHAQPKPGTTLPNLFQALFPCGSVTGAPKVRTSEIIAELESSPRGVYTGAIGFVSGGEAVFNVAIRTLVLDRKSGEMEMGLGSGITFDSTADAEYQECIDKMAFVTAQVPDFELLETLRYESGRGYLRLDLHLDRMEASARYFGFTWRPEAIRQALEASTADTDTAPSRVRIRLARNGEVTVEHQAISGRGSRPARVCIARAPIDSGDPFIYHKTTRREPYEMRRATHPDCDDVLLVNERGEITESTVANLVIRVGTEYFTPPISAGLLPGIYRGELLSRGIASERTILPEDLPAADAVYLVSSLRGHRIIEVLE